MSPSVTPEIADILMIAEYGHIVCEEVEFDFFI